MKKDTFIIVFLLLLLLNGCSNGKVVNIPNSSNQAEIENDPNLLNVEWHFPEQIDDVGLLNDLSEDQYVKYYEVGKIISAGQYQDAELLLAEFNPDNIFADDRFFYRIIREKTETKDQFILLSRYLIELEKNDVLYETTQKIDSQKVIIDANLKIKGLEFPKEIIGKEKGQILKLYEHSLILSEFFNAEDLEVMFTNSEVGDVYYCPNFYKRDSAWEASPLKFYVKSPDGIEIIYELQSDFDLILESNELAEGEEIIWDDGSTTALIYYRYDPLPCGSRGHLEIIEKNPIVFGDLKKSGETTSGEIIYELKDNNHPVLKALYEGTQPMYEVGLRIPPDAGEGWDEFENKFNEAIVNNPVDFADFKFIREDEYGIPLYEFAKPHPAQEFVFEGAEIILGKVGGYGNIKVTYEDFISSHQLIFREDSFGRLISLRTGTYISGCGAKPAIYLYPKEETDVSVKVDLSAEFLTTIPDYNKGWLVTAQKDGTLINKDDSKKYPYLFWEGPLGSYKIPKQGFVVEQKKVHDYLTRTLSLIGLNSQEIYDYLEFWEPKMKDAPFYFITFTFNEEIEKFASLKVNPQPDSVIRVLMDFRPLSEFEEVEVLEIPEFERNGFTVVEWGGVMN